MIGWMIEKMIFKIDRRKRRMDADWSGCLFEQRVEVKCGGLNVTNGASS